MFRWVLGWIAFRNVSALLWGRIGCIRIFRCTIRAILGGRFLTGLCFIAIRLFAVIWGFMTFAGNPFSIISKYILFRSLLCAVAISFIILLDLSSFNVIFVNSFIYIAIFLVSFTSIEFFQ